ncbi:MAG: 1-acyl-sn-glycerol-3-phosphate acyltransferase [Candidatus Gottesmanbacteria bacterium]|nr:1-acyl-sn-glycerol-3-phosphate acyltransferase [Candidatus Gottesmanbacteria bacterium]
MKTLSDLPLIGNLIQAIDQDIKRHSFIQAMSNVVRRSRTRLVVQGLSNEVKDILQTKPAVIVANHPDDAEVIALIATLPERKDIYLIVNARMVGIVKDLDRYLIPVYIEHHNNPYHHNQILSYLLKTYHPKKILTPEKEHERNIKSIARAARIVNGGGLVIIFPGRRSIDGHWFPGVSHLLRKVKNRKFTYISRIYLQGTSLLDCLRLIPFMSRLLPVITIHFAKPLQVSEVWNKDPKKITSNIENNYIAWIDGSFKTP